MKHVPLYHAGLGRWHSFPESSVEQWKRCGWQEKKPKKTSAPLVSEESTNHAAEERRDTEEH